MLEKNLLVRSVAGAAAGFGMLAIAAPRAMMAMYDVEPDPQREHLFRLWGSRNLALAVLALLAQPGRERDRMLTVAAGMSALDTLSSAASSRSIGGSTAARAAITTAGFAAAALAARALQD